MKKITDTAINKRFGIPISTIQDWKKTDKNNWRFKLYAYLKATLTTP